MQLTRQDIQIVEKVISTENGLYLARFAVVNVAGTFKWKLIDMVPVASPEAQHVGATTLALPSPVFNTVVEFISYISKTIVSPYQDFSFFTSQPTRAPNF